jgi:hypothetical protein
MALRGKVVSLKDEMFKELLTCNFLQMKETSEWIQLFNWNLDCPLGDKSTQFPLEHIMKQIDIFA